MGSFWLFLPVAVNQVVILVVSILRDFLFAIRVVVRCTHKDTILIEVQNPFVNSILAHLLALLVVGEFGNEVFLRQGQRVCPR